MEMTSNPTAKSRLEAVDAINASFTGFMNDRYICQTR